MKRIVLKPLPTKSPTQRLLKPPPLKVQSENKLQNVLIIVQFVIIMMVITSMTKGIMPTGIKHLTAILMILAHHMMVQDIQDMTMVMMFMLEITLMEGMATVMITPVHIPTSPPQTSKMDMVTMMITKGLLTIQEITCKDITFKI